MLKISDFFKKIQNKQTQQYFVLSVVQASLKKYAGFDVTLGQISFKSGTVVLKGIPQSARSQIFIKKSAIIQDINENQTIKVVSDIR